MRAIFQLTLKSRVQHQVHGGKAVGLKSLLKVGAKIPTTIIIPAGVEPNKDDINWIFHSLGSHIKLIVRSSSTLEDQESVSMAGAFKSYEVDYTQLEASIKKIRSHADKWERKANSKIPLLVQPLLAGIGGVYMASYPNGKENLTLSKFGPSAVTSGVTSELDRISKETSEYKKAISQCRKIQKKLKASVDFEVIIQNEDCFFVQYRPLTNEHIFNSLSYSNIPYPEGVLSSNSKRISSLSYKEKESNEANQKVFYEISEHFPFALSKLCGTLWARQLSCIFDSSVIYKKGFILGLQEIDNEVGSELDENDLKRAYWFYKKSLFVKWKKKIKFLKGLHNKNQPIKAWTEVYTAWTQFLIEYFNNPYESTIYKARTSCMSGGSFSPKTRRQIYTFRKAQKRLLSCAEPCGKEPSNWKELPEISLYLKNYGHYFLQGNDFSQPPLLEQSETFLYMLKSSIPPISINPNNSLEETDLLRAAWLAEDDNEYKHLFACQMRQAILGLANCFLSTRIIKSLEDIWNFSIEDLEDILEGKALDKQNSKYLNTCTNMQVNIIHKGIFPAFVLSPGSATGRTCKGYSEILGGILVRTTITEIDYPALLASSGAVVALGTTNSHAAIFSRDVGKPLYLCPKVVHSLSDETYLTLNQISKEIIVTPLNQETDYEN
jgi:hypothetical protein